MKSILLIEDNEEDVFFMQRAMKKSGVINPLQVVDDGQKAVEYLEGSGIYGDRSTYPLPSLILLDLKIPFIKGLDVLKWIRGRAELAKIIVIVFTSSALDSDIAHAYSLGANSYSIKPPSSDKLINFTKALQEYWLLHDHSCIGAFER